jgi:hypothetical protein
MCISFSAIVVLYNFSKKNKWNPWIKRTIERYGRYSLVIYVSHFSMLQIIIDKPVFHNIGNIYLIVIISVMSIIVIEACIIIKKMISLSAYLNLILFGEKKEKVIKEK